MRESGGKRFRSVRIDTVMNEAKRRKTAVVVCLVALFAAGVWVWLGYEVRKALRAELHYLAGPDARVALGRIGIDPLTRSVCIRNVRVAVDSGRTDGSLPFAKRLEVHVGRLVLNGVRFAKNGAAESISVDALTLDGPDVSLDRADGTAEMAHAVRREGRIGTLSIGKIVLHDGNFEDCGTDSGRKACRRIDGLSFETGGVVLDLADADPDRLARMGFALSVRHVEYLFGEGAMSFRADGLSVDTRQRMFSADSLCLSPRYAGDGSAVLASGHADRTRLTTGPVIGYGIDFPDLLQGKAFRADSLTVRGADVLSRKNRKVVRKERNKPLFFQTLRRLPVETSVGKVIFSGLKIGYEELPSDGVVAGTVTFDSLSGTLIPDPSDPSRLRLEADGKLMGVGDLHAVFLFPSGSSSDNRFEVEGRLGRFDLRAMNRATEPLARVRIDSGKIDEMRFRIEGDTVRASVSMSLLYDGLIVSIMKEDAGGRFRERRVLSALADEWLVRRSNPYGGTVRTGMGVAERDPYRSQFNYLWKSVRSGIEPIVSAGRCAGKSRDRDR